MSCSQTNQEINKKGKTVKNGVQLWPIGTDTAKSVIYGRYGIEVGQPASIHFSKDLPDEFYAQITAEKLITRYHRGHPIQEWVKPSHKRNEVLDCTVYALAAAYHLGMNKFSERDWSRLEDLVQPHTKDLFDSASKQEDDHPTIPDQVDKTAQNKVATQTKPLRNPRRNNKSKNFATNW